MPGPIFNVLNTGSLWGRSATADRRDHTAGTPPPAHDLIQARDTAREYLHRLVWPEPIGTPYRGPLDLDNLTGETHEIRLAYRELALKEPAAKSALRSKFQAVASQDAQVLPEDKGNPRDVAAAEFVDWSISRSRGGWPGLIRAIVTGALIEGYSLGEKVFEASTAGKYPGFWTLAEVVPLDTRWVRFDIDRYKQIANVRFMRVQGHQAFDPRDFVHYAYQSLYANPFGISDLRAAYRAIKLIEAAVKLRAILLENFSGPFLVGKYTGGDQGKKAEFMQVLRNARAMGYIVCTEDDSVEVLNLATSADQQFGEAIEDYRREIYTAVRGAYLPFTEGKTAQGGERRGDSGVQQDTTDLDAWDLAVDVCEVINRQIVPDLVRPNFGLGVGLPRVSLGWMDEDAILKRLEIAGRVQDLGVPVSMKQLYEISRVVPPTGPDDVARPPQQAGMPPGGVPPNDLEAGLFGDSSGRPGGGGGHTPPPPPSPDSQSKAYRPRKLTPEEWAEVTRDAREIIRLQKQSQRPTTRTD